jgi:uncharacterized protein (TIGR02246 family)
MSRIFLALALVVCFPVAACAQPSGERARDEAAIRAAIASYVEAYNHGDAGAVAAHWGDGGEWVNSDGERFEGRTAIEQAMKKFFEENQGVKLEVDGARVRFVTGDVAIEEGKAVVTFPGELPAESTYLAIHVKRDGAWKLSAVRETESGAPPAAHGEIGDLAWLVGDWVDGGEDATNQMSVKWSKGRAFLLGTFRVSVPGVDDDLEGTQVIGWDPSSETIRSWMFDSDGGFGGGVWTHDGDHWAVEFTQVLPDGRLASSTNIYTPIDDDHYGWESVDREVDGESLPDVERVTVVRKAMSAKEAAPAVAGQ